MKAPAPGPERNISYPEISERRLGNGLRVLVVEDAYLPRLSAELVLPVGRICNPDDNLALASLAVELTKSGTGRRSTRQISDLMDQLAIHYRNEVQLEHAVYSMTLLADQLEPALDLLSDIVLNPSFPEEELEKAKVRWKSHLISQRSQPGFLANECAFRTFYAAHPYAKVSMAPEHLEACTRDSVADFYRSHFVADHAHLLLAGPINPDTASTLSERFFGDWKVGEAPAVTFPPPPDITKPIVNLIHRPHSAQSYVLVGLRALPRAHPEGIRLQVVNQIFGGGASARLFLNLREEKGYTYGAYSRLNRYREDGLLVAAASVNSEVTLQATTEILQELALLSKRAPQEEELKRCQAELVGSFLRRMETPASVGTLEINRRLYGLPADFYSDFIPNVRGVTADMATETAQRYFDPQQVVITVVGDRTEREEELKQLGELRIFDVNGNQI